MATWTILRAPPGSPQGPWSVPVETFDDTQGVAVADRLALLDATVTDPGGAQVLHAAQQVSP